ncbi:MAG: hypothetical protein MUC96_13710 [Myxococcaceae bacterium]|jgi:hypothetical protein|nr:hypothetical protein [Myxococcaceae bacterium]
MAASRLARKNRGGRANFAGNAFEAHFAIWRLALVLEQLSRGTATRVGLQLAGAHVDDWVEVTSRERRHFQLKRSITAGWSAVRSDFEQELSSRRDRKPVKVCLVVPSEARAARLRAAKGRVRTALVLSFPSSLRPDVVMRARPCGDALRLLWSQPSMTESDLRLLWFALDEAWQLARRPGRLVSSSRVLRALPRRAIDFVRQSWNDPPGWERVLAAVAQVPGLSCKVEHGIVTFSGAGFSSRYSCRNPNLKQLAKKVLAKLPKSLDEFLELL